MQAYSREALARNIRFVLRNEQQRGVAQQVVRQPGRNGAGDPQNTPERALRILLVEDDPLIRFSTADMLTALGHTVEEAGDGESALNMLESGAFDVVVTDLSLPCLSGEEFAKRAAERWPSPRFVFATGYEMSSRPGAKGVAAVVLQEPYDERSIAAALKAATAAG